MIFAPPDTGDMLKCSVLAFVMSEFSNFRLYDAFTPMPCMPLRVTVRWSSVMSSFSTFMPVVALSSMTRSRAVSPTPPRRIAPRTLYGVA